MRRKIFTGLVICWMTVIFIFSARNADTSSQDSSRIGMLAGQIFIKDFEDWDLQKQLAFAKEIDHPVRKTAHAAEYAVLGMLLFGACYQMKEQWKKTAVLSWGVGTFYAATDEIHQLFVPGRSGQISDVLLDSSGVAAGVIFLLLFSVVIYYLFKKKKE